MKSTVYNYVSILALAAILAACGTDKSAKLEKLKTKQADLAKEIAALEKEMPVDSSKIKVKSKEVAVIQLTPQKFDHYVQTQGGYWIESNLIHYSY